MTASTSIGAFVDPVATAALLRGAGLDVTDARPEYLRHKPGETTIVGYDLTTGEGGHARGYVRWCESEQRAARILGKAAARRPTQSPVGVAVVGLNPNAVFFGFPNDARLHRLRWYTTPRKLKRSLDGLRPAGLRCSGSKRVLEVIRYNPARRAVARLHLAIVGGPAMDLLVRYSARPAAPALAEAARHLRRHGVPTPAPIAQLEAGHVTIDEYVRGREPGGTHGEEGHLTTEIAAVLETLHSAPLPPLAATRDAHTELDRARAALTAVARWDASLAGPAGSLSDLLVDSMPRADEPPTLLHGDLHRGNLLVGDDRLWLLDLDRTAVGPAAIDLGCLRADAIARDLRRPGSPPSTLARTDEAIDIYRSSNPNIDDRTIAWYTAVAVADQALLAMRTLTPGWIEMSSALVGTAIGLCRR
ncbi:MAG: aminoglycoside phosphotransferase family protein [Acidimicrobiales bacterium]